VQTRFEIAKLHRDFGRASTVYVTHDQVEAMTLADRILLLNTGEAVQREGSVAQCGSPLELYHRPRNLFVAGFIGSPKMNFLKGTLVSASPNSALVRVNGTNEQLEACVDARSLQPGTPVTLGIRPEHTELGTATQHIVRPVQWQERLGESTFLYLDAGDGEHSLAAGGDALVAKAPGHAHAVAGHRIALAMPATAIHLFDPQGHALPRLIADTDLLLPQAA
jgi:multiple sugar transport system ATP-binding protein